MRPDPRTASTADHVNALPDGDRGRLSRWYAIRATVTQEHAGGGVRINRAKGRAF